ncbi:MAG TPA: TIGR03084 family metal-binding protein [Pseudonocardiaceae bacterium]|nr:TIGR03084 family metal-binding protein [Pseudonocardiaceae bacterium]
MATDLRPLRDDLAAESDALCSILADLTPEQWLLPTPAAGWTIADQVSHLAYFDDTTLMSLVNPERFRWEATALTAAGDDFADRVAVEHRGLTGEQLLDWFRTSRKALIAGYGDVDPAARLPWYGPDMGVASSITARLMETWAHTQDIADTVGVRREPTSRLRHVAHIGIRALRYSFRVNGLAVPDAPIRVDLAGPDGDIWSWGPVDAVDRVTGTAMDFCLVVTQRRHRDDTALAVTGDTALAWIAIAQAFAGPAGPGRAREVR